MPVSTSDSASWLRFLDVLDLVRGGEGVCSGEDTSEGDSDSGSGSMDWGPRGRDLRGLLLGVGRISRVTLFRLGARLLEAD